MLLLKVSVLYKTDEALLLKALNQFSDVELPSDVFVLEQAGENPKNR